MMSFWDLSTGETAADTPKEYEVPGGNLDPIPNNSDVLAVIEAAQWQRKDKQDSSSPEFIELKWSVVAPEQYKNRKVFHKLWVTDLDPQAKTPEKGREKRDKARRMLAAIDANAGGNLTKTGEAPTNDGLAMHLCNKPMVVKVMVWSMKGNDGSDMAGNWISAVKPSNAPLSIGTEAPPKASQPRQRQETPGGRTGAPARDIDDEIPF